MFIRDEPFLGLIKGNDTPLQYTCLENPMHGQRSLVGCRPWGREESDTTERLYLLSYLMSRNKLWNVFLDEFVEMWR